MPANASSEKPDEPAVAETVPETSDVKQQFLAALQRKQESSGGSRTGGGPPGGKIHGEHGKAANKRQFRRKSGG